MRGRHLLLLLLPLLAACARTPRTPSASPAPAPAPSPAMAAAGAVESTEQDRAEVLASIQGFMDALRAQDTAAMHLYVDSLTRLTLLRPTREGGTRVVVMSGADFIRAVTQPGQAPIDEPIRNPVVHVSGDLASVWAEYQVRTDAGVSHCGFDAFHLARRDGRWMLLNVSDTFQRTGCGPAWPR